MPEQNDREIDPKEISTPIVNTELTSNLKKQNKEHKDNKEPWTIENIQAGFRFFFDLCPHM